MPRPEEYEVLILGSGKSGKSLAWHLAASRYRTAVVGRRWVGGACPNVNCLPSKNEIWSAKVPDLVHHAAKFDLVTGPIAIDMGRVRERKHAIVRDETADHLDLYTASGAELIVGAGRLVILTHPTIADGLNTLFAPIPAAESLSRQRYNPEYTTEATRTDATRHSGSSVGIG